MQNTIHDRHELLKHPVGFKKAFDSLEWNFIKKALEKFHFGAPLVQWISTFYSKIQSCVINNGYATSFFELERGVRQGCPFSGVLFATAVEILANSIRIDKLIMGINFIGREYKLSQYASPHAWCATKSQLKSFSRS